MKRRTFLAVLLVLGISILSTHLGVAAEQKVIKIGVLGPLTGDFAFGGVSMLQGAQLKAEEINAEGGNFKIELVSEDDAAVPNQSVTALKKLLSRDKIHALLGAWMSTCTMAIVPIVAQEGVPQYTTAIATPITQQGSKWLFRFTFPTSRLNQRTIEYAVQRLGIKKIAIFTSNDEVGKSAILSSEAALQKLGLKPAAKEEWNLGDKDFTGQLGRIQASGADAIIYTTGYSEMAIIARQVHQLGMKVQLLGGDQIPGSDKFVELAGPDGEGIIFSTPFIPSEDDPKIGPFITRFKKRFNRLPDTWAAQAYDVVALVHTAVKAKGVVDRKAIRDYTRDLKTGAGYPALSGNFRWDEQGELLLDPMVAQVESGKKWKLLQR